MNKKLQNLIALNQNVKVYVPSKIKDIEINNEEFVNATLEFLSNCFGGSTSYLALGAWISPINGLIKEKVNICESFCGEKQLQDYIENLYDFCLELRNKMEQEVIALEVNGILHFVK